MKKLLLAAVLGCLFVSSGASAWWMNGATVTSISANQTGVAVGATAYSENWQYTLNPNVNTKEMLALLMTAQTTGATVNMEINGSYVDSVSVLSP